MLAVRAQIGPPPLGPEACSRRAGLTTQNIIKGGQLVKAAIYARQSLDVTEGIDRQIARCQKLIDAKDWTLGATYRDNDTSATKSRGAGTAWAEMLAAVKAKEIDVVVAVDLDRLLRTTTDMVALIALGGRVLTVDGEIDLTTADGEFRATMLAGIARFEVRRKSERQIRANNHRVDNGLPVPGGRRRFGFESDHLTVRPDEAEWIRFMYGEALNGSSLRSIAAKMNDEGVPCVTKGTWDSRRIRKILVNPAYSGKVIHGGQGYDSSVVPVVVDPELAAKVKSVVENPARRKSPGPARSALLSGLASCGACDEQLVSAGTGRKGAPVALYICKSVKAGLKDGQRHAAIRRALLDARIPGGVYKALQEAARRGNEPDSTDSPIGHHLATIADIERQRIVVQELATMPGANLAHTRQQLANLAIEQGEAQAKIDAAAASSGSLVGNARALVDVIARTEATGRDLADMHDMIELDASEEGSKTTAAFLVENLIIREEYAKLWRALTLEEKRSLIRATLRIVVHPVAPKQTSSERIQIKAVQTAMG